MFVKFEYDDDSRLYWLIDDDFTEPLTDSSWDNIARIYEQRGFNVAPNLFRVMMWWSKNTPVAMSYIMNHIKTGTTTIKYIDEINKYLMLV